MSLALQLAQYLNNVRHEDLPTQAIEHAKMIIVSTFASAAPGTVIGSAAIMRDLAKEHGGAPDASVWFDGAKLPLTEVVRVNAMLSDAAASDTSRGESRRTPCTSTNHTKEVAAYTRPIAKKAPKYRFLAGTQSASVPRNGPLTATRINESALMFPQNAVAAASDFPADSARLRKKIGYTAAMIVVTNAEFAQS